MMVLTDQTLIVTQEEGKEQQCKYYKLSDRHFLPH